MSQFTALQFPRFNLGTYSALGATRVVNYEAHDTWSIQPNLSWTHGRHAMKYGAESASTTRTGCNLERPVARTTFDRRWTQADPLRADALSGNEFASFLLGVPSTGFVDRNIDPAYQNKYYVFYVQDDWKLRPNLTLNLGLALGL